MTRRYITRTNSYHSYHPMKLKIWYLYHWQRNSFISWNLDLLLCSKGSPLELIEKKLSPFHKSTYYLCGMDVNIILPSTSGSLKCSLLIAIWEVRSTTKTDKLDSTHYIAWNWIAAKCAVYHKWWACGRESNSKSARKGKAFTRNKRSAIWWHKTSVI